MPQGVSGRIRELESRSPGDQSKASFFAVLGIASHCCKVLHSARRLPRHSVHQKAIYKELIYKAIIRRQEGAKGHQLESTHLGTIFAERRIKPAIKNISLDN